MQKVTSPSQAAATSKTKTAIVNHLGIIPDGNRRWAKSKGVSVYEGYRRGAKRGIEIARKARELGAHTLTVWGLSTENWMHRPAKELNFIVTMLVDLIDRHLKDAVKHGVQVVHLGRKDRLPKQLIGKLKQAEAKTLNYDNHILNLALDYGGQDEIIRAAKAMIGDANAGKLKPEALDQPANGHEGRTVFDSYLDTGKQPFPNPDLIIRTSGEIRLSGFMAGQGTYAELYFEPANWPDFTPAKLDKAIAEYGRRHRRFGGDI